MEKVVPATEILEKLHAEYPLRAVAAQYRGEVARRFVYEDGQGEIGLIASVTRPFCGDCTRARLTTEGELFTCLFGQRGTDLRLPLRRGASDAELLDILRATWRERDDRYSELRRPEGVDTGRVEMFRMGG
jgi:cyclic pyranopterin phosphate synthase